MEISERASSLIKKSSTTVGIDLGYFLKGGFWLSSSQVISSAIAFILSIYLANKLSKDVYGNYRYILSIASILGSFSLTGLNTAIVQSVARGFEGSLRQAFRLSLSWSFLSILITLGGSFYYLYKDNTVLGYSLLIIALINPFLNSAGLFAGYINGKKDFKRQSLYTCIDNIVPSLCVMGTVMFTHNIIILISIYFLSSFVIAGILYIRTIKVFQPQKNTDPTLKNYSIKLSLLNIVSIIASQIDKVVVFTFLGSIELAVYGIALAFPEQIRGLIRNMSNLLIPRFAERDMDIHRVNIWDKTRKVVVFLLIITIAYIITAPLLFKIFYPKYLESILYSQIYSIVILGSIAWIPGSIFIAQKNDLELAKLSIYGSVIQIILLIPFVYYFGLWGMIIGRMLGVYGNTALSYILYIKNYKKNETSTS